MRCRRSDDEGKILNGGGLLCPSRKQFDEVRSLSRRSACVGQPADRDAERAGRSSCRRSFHFRGFLPALNCRCRKGFSWNLLLGKRA